MPKSGKSLVSLEPLTIVFLVVVCGLAVLARKTESFIKYDKDYIYIYAIGGHYDPF